MYYDQRPNDRSYHYLLGAGLHVARTQPSDRISLNNHQNHFQSAFPLIVMSFDDLYLAIKKNMLQPQAGNIIIMEFAILPANIMQLKEKKKKISTNHKYRI